MSRRSILAFTIMAVDAVSAFTSSGTSTSRATFVSSTGPLHLGASDDWGHLPEDQHHPELTNVEYEAVYGDDTEEIPYDHQMLSTSAAGTSMPTKFAVGDELHLLRKEVMELRGQLEESRSVGKKVQALDLEHAILRAQKRDPEFAYSMALERLRTAEDLPEIYDVDLLRKEAAEARSALPQLNLEGLWVGKYGDSGYEMINVTYVGDVLYAYKITGDGNVPKGELSFKVDLGQGSAHNGKDNQVLEPIELGEFAAKQWGAKFLNRFSGEGQVASEGYRNAKYIEGQLIMVNDYFSFAWVPIGHQVFFGRPSAELVLKLLRDSTSDLDKDRAFLTRCVEETEMLEEEMEDSEVYMHQEKYYDQEGCFE